MGSAGWVYQATANRVIDGDTIIFDYDLGFALTMRMSTRLLGLNCDELGTPAGDYAALWVTALLPPGAPVVIESVRWDAYGGRVDGLVYLSDGRSLTTLLIDLGLAAPWNGRGPRPVPLWPPPGGIPPLPGAASAGWEPPER